MPEPGAEPLYQCGQWEIDTGRRELRANGVHVPIGDRAFEIIEVLVRSAGELVTKDELMGLVWPSVIVGDNTLQVHISAIRKALGTDRGMLQTASGRGYRLLGDWVIRGESAPARAAAAVPDVARTGNLPLSGVELIGRTTAIRHVGDLLSACRAVTLTGPGGIGKTSLALAVARGLLPAFHGDAWLVELASLSNPALVPSAVAGVLGLRIGAAEISAAAIARAIGGRQLLLVLDNCEHVIDAAARLVEAVVHACPLTSVLATSRELLRIEGESAYPVPPLDVPRATETDPETMRQHGASQLFIARMKASGSGFAPDPWSLKMIGAICRRLDGIPLAIEFAASRAVTLGLDEVVVRLDNRFDLLTGGRRTALPRQKTLRATLDWSYELLPEPEQLLLCGLSVFAGGFTIEAAACVMSDAASSVAEGIADLVAKSLVVFDASGMRWRLLETIRVYASQKLAERGGVRLAARRHAEFFRDFITSLSPAAGVTALHAREIDNVRAALDWAFSADGDRAIGIALTASFAPVWMHLSLMSECQQQVERALLALAAGGSAGDDSIHHEMMLFLALGGIRMYTAGAAHETRAVWAKALERAERLGNVDYCLRALWGLWVGHIDAGEFRQSLTLAEQFRGLADRGTDPVEPLIGARMMGFSLHFLGDQTGARHHLEEMLRGYDARVHQSGIVRFQSDQRVRARTRLAVVLWLQGYPDRAMRAVEESVDEAMAGGHAGTLASALAQGACRVALACGDLAAASRFVTLLLADSARHDLRFLHTLGRCFEATLLVRQHEVDRGLRLLRDTMNQPEIASHGLWFTGFLCDLADAYGKAGDTAMGLATLDTALERTERLDEGWCRAELLHLKGRLMLQRGLPGDAAGAESLLRQALDIATEQATLSWALRAATSLARLWHENGQMEAARSLLVPVYGRFTEGFATADLREAAAVLEAIAER